MAEEKPKVAYFKAADSLSISKSGRWQKYVFRQEGAPVAVLDLIDAKEFRKDASLTETDANGNPYSHTEQEGQKPISRVSVKDVVPENLRSSETAQSKLVSKKVK